MASDRQTGELTQVDTPGGGSLLWQYATHTYAGGQRYREVRTRQMRTSASGTLHTWTITPANDPALNLHPSVTLVDVGASAQRYWGFRTDAGAYVGLANVYEERNGAGTALLKKDYTWTQDPAGNVYVGAVLSTLDPGAAHQAQSKTEQTLDVYGNVTQSKIYDYGNLTTPARTHAYTYLGGAYTNLYIRNRVSTATLTAGAQTITLATNTYDQGVLIDRTGLTTHDTAFGTSNTLRGNLTRSVVPGATRNTSYDIGGMPVTSDDGQGHLLSITAGPSTNYAAPSTLKQTFNNHDYANNLTYNPALMPATSTGLNGETSTNTYDSFGRVATRQSVYGATTTFAYDYSQHTVTATTSSSGPASLTPRWERTTTDGFGRTVKTEAGGSSTQIMAIVETRYAPCACSPLGKVTQVSSPRGPSETAVWTTYTYDALGRTLTVTAPDGVSVTSYEYKGNRTKVTDPAGKWKEYTTDAMGNLIRVAEPNPAGGADLITDYTYNALNRLTQVSMTRGGTTQLRTFTYDSATQRLTASTTPEGGTVGYSYHADGTLATKTDAKGQQTRFTYDGLARLRQARFYPDGVTADPCQQVDYTYDEPIVFGTTSNSWGRLTGLTWKGAGNCDYTFTENYAYDIPGAVVSQRLTVGKGSFNPLAFQVDYLRDAEGRPSVVWIPAPTGLYPNNIVSYTTDRDALGRATGLYTGTPSMPTTIVSAATYNAAGGMLSMTSTYFNETRQYNLNQQLTRITATGAHTMDVSYAFPPANNGRAQSTTDHVSGETVAYTYDQLNRLIQAGGMTFEYDGFGNLTKQGSATIAVNASTNRIASAGYQYDLNGNLTQAPGATHTYDVANRLVSNGAVYDPKNRRVFDGTYIYLYRVDGKLAGRYNPVLWASGQVPSRAYIDGGPNVYFGKRLLAERGQWVMTDRLGSVRVNAAGERSTYSPYGSEAVATTNGRTKFATYMRESSGGLDYAMNRYYSAAVGRFTTPDPAASGRVGNPASWNRYAYVEGDPVNYADPLGLCQALPGTLVCISTTVTATPTGADSSAQTPSSGVGGSPGAPAAGSSTSVPDTGRPSIDLEPYIGLSGPGPGSIAAQACTINEYIVGTCDDAGYVASAGLLGRIGARAAGAGTVAWYIASSVVGRAGERVVGSILNLTKNSTPITNTLSGTPRIPDFWNVVERVIVEVKNVSSLSYTAQIRDMAQWAANNPGYTFQLWVNENAQLTPELQQAIANGWIQLERFGWP